MKFTKYSWGRAALFNWILKNNKTKQVASHIPFKKQKGKGDVDGSEAFWSAVKNLGEALKPGLEGSVSLKNVEKSSAPPVKTEL